MGFADLNVDRSAAVFTALTAPPTSRGSPASPAADEPPPATVRVTLREPARTRPDPAHGRALDHEYPMAVDLDQRQVTRPPRQLPDVVEMRSLLDRSSARRRRLR